MPRPRVIRYPHVPRFQAEPPILMPTDQAVPIDVDQVYIATKGSAGAYSIAAPGAANVGRRLKLLTGSDFAHVFTFTGSTLRDGTTGASITWTATAFQGCALEVVAINATTWNVQAMNLGAIA